MDKGIPVVTIDSGVDDKDASLCYIATDNVKGGEAAADELAKQIGDKGKVGLLSFFKGAVSSDEREDGFKKGIAKHPNIKIVSIRYSQSDNAKATDETVAMLTANPDLAGIFASNEPNGVFAASVLEQKHLAGKVSSSLTTPLRRRSTHSRKTQSRRQSSRIRSRWATRV